MLRYHEDANRAPLRVALIPFELDINICREHDAYP